MAINWYIISKRDIVTLYFTPFISNFGMYPILDIDIYASIIDIYRRFDCAYNIKCMIISVNDITMIRTVLHRYQCALISIVNSVI